MRRAFWSGHLDARVVRSVFAKPEQHVKMAKAFFESLPVTAILHHMGHTKFIAKWPHIRTMIFNSKEPKDTNRLRLFDAAWAVIVTGDSQYPVTEAVGKLSKGRRSILKIVANDPGISIYRLAKTTKRPYSRVHKEVTLLSKEHILNVTENVAKGRRVASVFAVDSANTQLFSSANCPPGRP